MNVSKLTLAQQSKAFSDAAEYNRLKAKSLWPHLRSNVESIKKHLDDAELFATECRRLQQTSRNLQR